MDNLYCDTMMLYQNAKHIDDFLEYIFDALEVIEKRLCCLITEGNWNDSAFRTLLSLYSKFKSEMSQHLDEYEEIAVSLQKFADLLEATDEKYERIFSGRFYPKRNSEWALARKKKTFKERWNDGVEAVGNWIQGVGETIVDKATHNIWWEYWVTDWNQHKDEALLAAKGIGYATLGIVFMAGGLATGKATAIKKGVDFAVKSGQQFAASFLSDAEREELLKEDVGGVIGQSYGETAEKIYDVADLGFDIYGCAKFGLDVKNDGLLETLNPFDIKGDNYMNPLVKINENIWIHDNDFKNTIKTITAFGDINDGDGLLRNGLEYISDLTGIDKFVDVSVKATEFIVNN